MTPRAYYNENNAFAAAWLRNLITAGHIAPGDVDERDIRDVTPNDLRGYTQAHFFAGIGLWSYALRRVGIPDSEPVWTGSCPCQPFSNAGKGAGFADERHLWPAWFHLIRVCQPPHVFGEQVSSKDGLTWFDLVQSDLEGEAYASWGVDTCAAGVGAPHIRQRLYWAAEKVGVGQADSDLRIGGQGRSLSPGGDRGGDALEWGRSSRSLGAYSLAYREGVGRAGRTHDGDGGRGKCSLGQSGEACQLGDACESGAGRDAGSGACSQAPRESRRSENGGECDAPLTSNSNDSLGDTERAGLARRSRQSRDDGRQFSPVERTSEDAGGVGVSASGGLQRERYQSAHGEPMQTISYTGVMADNDGAGLRQRSQPDGDSEQSGEQAPRRSDVGGCCTLSADYRPGPLNGYWANADWLLCTDGRWRPARPGSQPLVDGRPGRVGALRAYGNALCAETAVEFLRAYIDACADADAG